MALHLNQRARDLVERSIPRCCELAVHRHEVEGGGEVLDCGVEARGGLEAGLLLARVTLADLAEARIVPGAVLETPCPHVVVHTDHPVAACMASQYAGWQISVGDFFAMGSGPFRAVYGGEKLYDSIGLREDTDLAVGALESRHLPGPDVIAYVAEKTGVSPRRISLLVAPTASLAGGVQVVARSVETALHKLHEIGFDLGRVASGFGSAPLPPPAKNDLDALGRTNDAVLYGASVTLWVHGDDDSLVELGQKVPSSTSRDYGATFAEIFARYDHDFYKIDPHLFSPAEVTFHNLDSGRTHRFGERRLDIVQRSFFS